MKAGVEGPLLSTESEEGILSIVIQAPPWNILDTALLETMEKVLQGGDRESVRVLLLRAEGKGFSAGASVQEHFPQQVGPMLRRFRQVLVRLYRFPVPTLAVIHGVALGAGLELASAADLVFCAEEARLGQPEIQLGALAPAALVFLPRRVGRHRALDLLFSGRQVSGREALSWGLVDFAVPEGELLSRAEAYAHDLARLSPVILRQLKQAALELGTDPAAALEQSESFYLSRVAPQADYLEGLKAFLEKRKPLWGSPAGGGQ